MKHNRTLALFVIITCAALGNFGKSYAQSAAKPLVVEHQHNHEHAQPGNDSLAGFNESAVRARALEKGLTPYETEQFVEQHKKNYIRKTFYNDQFVAHKEQVRNNAGMRLGPINPTPQAPCTNMDFETGNFTGWTGSIGDNTLSSTGPLQNPIAGFQTTGMDAALNDMNARHTIVSTGTDPCGGFPMVAPGGNYSVRLGGTTANYQGEILEQTFTVAPGNTSFTYQYAVVLNDGGHSSGEQPYFKIEMFDQSGNLVPCSQYYVEASGTIPGFLNCGVGTSYKPWTTVNIDLSSFVTANVTIRFTVAGCIYAGHYGYAYVDCSCLPYAIALSDSLCQGNSITLSAPPGAQNYNWTLGSPPAASIGTADSLVVSAAGNYYVEMISVTGCTTYLNVTVGIYPQPTASFNPQFPPCSPNYTFQNTSTVSSGTMTYYWDFGDPLASGDTSIATSPSYVYTPPGPYTVWLYVTTANGCNDSISQTVNPGNGGLANFSAPQVCVGAPTNFTDMSVNPTDWSWHFGDPSTPADSSNLQNPTYTYPAAGTYTVLLTAGTSPCPSTYTTTVTVHALPTASFIYNQICGGQTVNFTSTSTIPATDTISTYSWNFGDPGSGPNNTSALLNPSHTFSSSGTYTVTLVTTSTAGCPSTYTMSLVVGPSPVAAFSATTVCSNTPMQFTNNSQNSVNYFWNFGDGSTLADTSLLQNPAYTYTASGTYTVVLTAEPSSNCYDTAQLVVTVAPGPSPAFTSPQVCDGTLMPFTDQSTISSGNITNWSWNFGTGNPGDTSNVQSPGFMYPAAGVYTVTLTLTSNNGCTTVLTQPVTVNANPTANFSANTVCIGSPTQFTDLSVPGSGMCNLWGWDFGDGSPLGSGQNPSHTYTNDSTYNVILIVQNSNGCLDTIVLQATTAPQPVVDFAADTLAGCSPLCVNFSDLTTIASGSITGWQWDFGDGSPWSVSQSPSHCFTLAGTYDIALTTTSNNGCVQTYLFPQMIEVFPSPVAIFTATPPVTTVSQTHVDFTDQSIANNTISSWVWDFGTGSDFAYTQNAGFTYTQEYGSTYPVTLTVTNNYGCVDDTTMDVIVEPEFTFYIPNAFTPNGDGLNDYFIGQGIGIAQYEMWIFDRWGNLIFHCTDMNQAWDGTVQGSSGELCQIDTYVWKVSLTDDFAKRHKYVGHVSLIR